MIDELQAALVAAGGAVGLSAIYLAGLLALWYGKSAGKTGMRELFWYALVMLVICISPMRSYATLLLPVAPLVLRLTAEATLALRERRERLLFTLAVAALLLLAGTSDFSLKGWSRTVHAAEVPAAEAEALELAERYREESGKEELLLWGKSEIISCARRYTGRLCLLYDRSLWEGIQDVQFYVPYESWHYEAYELMEEAQRDPERIAWIGAQHGCEVLILGHEGFLREGVTVEPVIGDYRLYQATEEYLVYVLREAVG